MLLTTPLCTPKLFDLPTPSISTLLNSFYENENKLMQLGNKSTKEYEEMQEAYENNCAPKIFLKRTNKKVTKLIDMSILKQFAIDIN